MAKNKKVIFDAKDTLIKVVAPQLKFLPPKLRYKIIFMNRQLEEVISSQLIMSQKEQKEFPIGLLNHYSRQLEEIEAEVLAQPNIDYIKINYKDAINSPKKVAEIVAEFLNELDLDVSRMKEVIDPDLYRNKI